MKDPFLIEQPFAVSFSGGRTSAYMLWRILQTHGGRMPEQSAVIFCNTGKERLETLDFVERCSLEWNVPVVWLEYRRWEDDPGEAAGRWSCAPRRNLKTGKARPRTGLEVVNYATASRNGEPFDLIIDAKQMLPNVAIRFCTQWLKIKTSWRYCRKILGWKVYENCIGLRYDEPRRNAKPESFSTPGEMPVMPLKDARVTTQEVMDFWMVQRGGLSLDVWLSLEKKCRPGWDLELRPDEGNCSLCFLKGQKKLVRLMRERPEDAEWWIEKERQFQGKTRLFEAGRFRKAAPSYEATLRDAQSPQLFDDLPDDDIPDCRCTDSL